jgi:hypothetical protein
MNIRQSIYIILLLGNSLLFAQTKVEKWKIFEITLQGSKKGNPFIDNQLIGTFSNGNDTVTVNGFYDGEGIYKVRFMPEKEGTWSYSINSNDKKTGKKKGQFLCTPAQKGNHGLVTVKDTFNFAYSDGTPHYSFGTTCYAWVHQGDSLANLTLKTLSKGQFNKIRMCIFPKSYDWNNNEPLLYPFEGTPPEKWDFSRFNPIYFRNIENRIRQLDSLGIEADLIVFHPYDSWGFSKMPQETDERYIRYIIARFAAYKNVWWSLANEYDLMWAKKMEDWNKFLKLFAETDPYHHLRSIHNCVTLYDHTNPLITHVSIQNEDTYKAREYRVKYKKPIIFDECRYEGNIHWSWGNITAQTMVEKFWRGVINGGYVGHSETYVYANPIPFPEKSSEKIWWSHGGTLKGESPERIKFLRTIMESAPENVKPISFLASWMPFATLGIPEEYYLVYYNDAQPSFTIVELPENKIYDVEVIDTWNMTIKLLDKTYSGKCIIELPARPYIALRIVKRK